MSAPATHSFRLYLSGTRVGSERVEPDLRAILDRCVPGGSYELEVIDLARQPGRAAADSVLATPTLLKLLPAPVRRLVGDLTDANVVCKALDLGAPKPA